MDVWERTLYSIGAGASVIVVTMLLLSYLPGQILRWQTFAAFDAILVVLWLGVALRRPAAQPAPLAQWPLLWNTVPRRWFLAALITLALVAGFLQHLPTRLF